MTDPDRRLAALAAALVPERAGALLARAPSARAAAEATRLALLPREHRLAALAAALDGDGPRRDGRRVTTTERPRVAAVLARVRAGGALPPGAAPLLERIARERRNDDPAAGPALR